MRLYRRIHAASFASLALLFAPCASAADDPSQVKDAPPPLSPTYPKVTTSGAAEKTPKRYGYQILFPTMIFDAIAFLGVGLEANGNTGIPIVAIGLVGRSLTGPIVHLAHGQNLRALGSLGLEVLWLPAMGGLLPLSFCDEQCGTGAYLLAGLPVVVGITSTLIDSFVLAKEPPSPPQDKSNMGFSFAPYMAPSYSLNPHTGDRHPALQLGLVGQF